MFCAQYGNVLAFYGNIQCGFYNPPRYAWGAWELPEHYQKPMPREEMRVVEERRGDAPATPVFKETYDNNELILMRMQHEVRMREIENYRPSIVERQAEPKTNHYEDEDFFILM